MDERKILRSAIPVSGAWVRPKKLPCSIRKGNKSGRAPSCLHFAWSARLRIPASHAGHPALHKVWLNERCENFSLTLQNCLPDGLPNTGLCQDASAASLGECSSHVHISSPPEVGSARTHVMLYCPEVTCQDFLYHFLTKGETGWWCAGE